MNRCLLPPRLRLTALLLAACVGGPLALPVPAAAQTAQATSRSFPPAARRGRLVVSAPPAVLLNGQAARLSPGARIRSSSNLLVLSASLVGQELLVNYVRDPQGLIHAVWILSETEAQEARAGMEPVTNFSFASDADKPKTDDGKTPFDQLPQFPRQ